MAAEGGGDTKPSGRATGKRTKMTRVAIEDFHVRLQSRSPSPNAAQVTTKKRRRRLNAEELGVAEGLLNLQEVTTSATLYQTMLVSSPILVLFSAVKRSNWE